MKINNKSKNIKKFTELAILDFKHSENVKNWTHKQLADYLIQSCWAKESFGTLNIAVLDRVIEELFELDTIQKIGATMTNKSNCNTILKELANSTEDFIEVNRDNLKNLLKPNKNAQVPEYDKLSEGCDPDKCQCKRKN